MIFPYPDILRRAEFIRIRFHLEFQEPFHLSRERTLRLRRDLRQAARLILEGRDAGGRFEALFDPPLSPDPVALKRHQRPGPPFAIFPPSPRTLAEGDVLHLEVVFWGKGMLLLSDFARALTGLGGLGWHRGEGRFELSGVEGVDAAGSSRPLWLRGGDLRSLVPPVLDAGWWLETAHPPSPPFELAFLSPARLMTGERPLFRPTFSRVFPFLLRRVSSLLHAACALDAVDDPSDLLAAAARVSESASTLAWTDWRALEGEGGRQELGGITGGVHLQGEGLEEIFWVLALASLANVGKGASFGAGHLRLREI